MARISIAQFARKTQSTLDESARAIKLELFGAVIDDTRVDTGRLKGNWQTSTAAPITQTIERLDRTGSAVRAEAQRVVTSRGVDYLVNNLPYAPVYEERDAMIERNMARIQRIVKNATR